MSWVGWSSLSGALTLRISKNATSLPPPPKKKKNSNSFYRVYLSWYKLPVLSRLAEMKLKIKDSFYCVYQGEIISTIHSFDLRESENEVTPNRNKRWQKEKYLMNLAL